LPFLIKDYVLATLPFPSVVGQLFSPTIAL
jgi:hypothetical protein